MPPPPVRHRHHDGDPPPQLQPQSQTSPPKPNQRLLSLLLRTIIMIILTSLFFVFLGFAAIILFTLCVAGRRAFNHRRHPLRGCNNSSAGLSPHDLKRVPQFKYQTARQKGDDEKVLGYQSECVVCLEKFRDGQFCRRLVGCDHVFHGRCVDIWLLKKAACPLCRRPVSSSSGSSASCSILVPEDCRIWWWDVGSDDLTVR